ncbi:hypothetical protein [uncultured Brevundimonas sp.]|uniref:hypothetical protein n=1 Tax=uncultured Brevundimonas sp. TaxID=213418 RepID=UPI002602E8C8|nr:hypothetical protein [uncultured Brevundimonas sp.]
MIELIGSEKQIAWASEIRQQMQPIVADMLRIANRAEAQGLAYLAETIIECHALLTTTASASEWIDLRMLPATTGFSVKAEPKEDQTSAVMDLVSKYCGADLRGREGFRLRADIENYRSWDDEDEA